jgi:hypothetical protein
MMERDRMQDNRYRPQGTRGTTDRNDQSHPQVPATDRNPTEPKPARP